MSESCTFCGVISRNACSTYKRRYQAEEVSKCPNLDPRQRLLQASILEGSNGPYTEILRLRDEYEGSE